MCVAANTAHTILVVPNTSIYLQSKKCLTICTFEYFWNKVGSSSIRKSKLIYSLFRQEKPKRYLAILFLLFITNIGGRLLIQCQERPFCRGSECVRFLEDKCRAANARPSEEGRCSEVKKDGF